jgi:hypothetical protein
MKESEDLFSDSASFILLFRMLGFIMNKKVGPKGLQATKVKIFSQG